MGTTHKIKRGYLYDDFEVGRRFDHHWGRTVTENDSILFTTLTQSYNPMYFNVEYARSLGHPSLPINPVFVADVVIGLSVEDLTERGGPFLGVTGMRFGVPVYHGDTIYSSSVVVSRRPSDSRPGWGIVEWRTTGRNQRDEVVVEYSRTNFSRMREAQETSEGSA